MVQDRKIVPLTAINLLILLSYYVYHNCNSVWFRKIKKMNILFLCSSMYLMCLLFFFFLFFYLVFLVFEVELYKLEFCWGGIRRWGEKGVGSSEQNIPLIVFQERMWRKMYKSSLFIFLYTIVLFVAANSNSFAILLQLPLNKLTHLRIMIHCLKVKDYCESCW